MPPLPQAQAKGEEMSKFGSCSNCGEEYRSITHHTVHGCDPRKGPDPWKEMNACHADKPVSPSPISKPAVEEMTEAQLDAALRAEGIEPDEAVRQVDAAFYKARIVFLENTIVCLRSALEKILQIKAPGDGGHLMARVEEIARGALK